VTVLGGVARGQVQALTARAPGDDWPRPSTRAESLTGVNLLLRAALAIAFCTCRHIDHWLDWPPLKLRRHISHRPAAMLPLEAPTAAIVVQSFGCCRERRYDNGQPEQRCDIHSTPNGSAKV
jgi:hypothetical protein